VERALQRAVSDGTATSGYVRQILKISHPRGLLSDTGREPPKGLTLGPIDCGSPQGYDGMSFPVIPDPGSRSFLTRPCS
jgi:hypothetical protein